MSFKFEYEINHPIAGAIFDVNHKYSEKDFGEIILIRCIEQHQDEIRKDPEFLLPLTQKQIKKFYKNYCTTQINLDIISLNVIQDTINLVFLHS